MKYNVVISILIFCSLSSCRKFVDPGSPTTQLGSKVIFNNEATATGAQLAIYAGMESGGFVYNVILQSGLSADEFINYSSASEDINFALNNLTPDNYAVSVSWTNLYSFIYQANAVLEGLEGASNISSLASQQLKGEAKFVRAFCHFYLTGIFGDIPIVRTTDYASNTLLSRNKVDDVYDFIAEDLRNAAELLPENYLGGNNRPSAQRVRPNKWAAVALLARVYLYQGKWQQAETESSKVIAFTSLYSLLPNPDKVFLANSTEAIWQLMAIVPQINSQPGSQLILKGRPALVALDTAFVNSFQLNDSRKVSWVNSVTDGGFIYFYPFKYKIGQNVSVVTEYTMVLRLAEQYLIRSEARANQNKLSEATSDLNIIRERAGLAPLPVLPLADLLRSIQNERKFELFTEFGDRWLNLKRTNTATSILSALKGSNWASTDQLYPIPQSEINLNRNLTQNPGY